MWGQDWQQAGRQEVGMCSTRGGSWGMYITFTSAMWIRQNPLWLWNPEETSPEIQPCDSVMQSCDSTKWWDDISQHGRGGGDKYQPSTLGRLPFPQGHTWAPLPKTYIWHIWHLAFSVEDGSWFPKMQCRDDAPRESHYPLPQIQTQARIYLEKLPSYLCIQMNRRVPGKV